MELQWMPGPTDEARALQLNQCELLDAFYDTWNTLAAQLGRGNLEAIHAHPDYQAAKARYEASVSELEEMLGPDAHCNSVDAELWSSFSDCYKADKGLRPRWHMTRAQVQAYFRTPQTA
jgi:hypothetical protein